jgi:hypothetical protein
MRPGPGRIAFPPGPARPAPVTVPLQQPFAVRTQRALAACVRTALHVCAVNNGALAACVRTAARARTL